MCSGQSWARSPAAPRQVAQSCWSLTLPRQPREGKGEAAEQRSSPAIPPSAALRRGGPVLPSRPRWLYETGLLPAPTPSRPTVCWEEVNIWLQIHAYTRAARPSLEGRRFTTCAKRGFFSIAVASSAQRLRPSGKLIPRPGHAKLPRTGCEGPGRAAAPAPPFHTNPIGYREQSKGPRFASLAPRPCS